jgi:hypothetical protein
LSIAIVSLRERVKERIHDDPGLQCLIDLELESVSEFELPGHHDLEQLRIIRLIVEKRADDLQHRGIQPLRFVEQQHDVTPLLGLGEDKLLESVLLVEQGTSRGYLEDLAEAFDEGV